MPARRQQQQRCAQVFLDLSVSQLECTRPFFPVNTHSSHIPWRRISNSRSDDKRQADYDYDD
jgi:hypothetical protein